MHDKNLTIREVVGVFDTSDALDKTVDHLVKQGFERRSISLLASQEAVEEKLGHRFKKIQELEDDPNVPRQAYTSVDSTTSVRSGLLGGLMYLGAAAAAGGIVMTGGTLAGAVIAGLLGGGMGGLIGDSFGKVMELNQAEHIQYQLERGGLLLWVHVRNSEEELTAKSIMAEFSAHDIHAHELPL
ncbi:MAG: hypothetical protein ACPGXY_03235 [Alphaproteobacteria bacterium]